MKLALIKHPAFFIFLIFLGIISSSYATKADPQFPIVPYPQKVVPGIGRFTFTAKTKITIPANRSFQQEASLLNELLPQKLTITAQATSSALKNTIRLLKDLSITTEEGYRIEITADQVNIYAGKSAGIFRAVESIRQLLPVELENKSFKSSTPISLPSVLIEDAPVYAWRGMHLDVARHFFSIGYLKKFIDLLALYKFNKFHLHLTDDQGWRMEIKKYPLLTEIGAWRTFNNQDSACIKKSVVNPDFALDPKHIVTKNGKTMYGGFYTQTQLKDLVSYATKRHIEIIPEIDMPGHMMAAINAYPFLTCNGENKWGELFTKPICPCSESTFTFAEDVFKEVMAIFPSKYIHIGGDEVDRSDWAKSAVCKAFMEKEGIKDLPGLQSYFINRMERFFNAHDRKLIGWDEILEGGISPTALVMYWRSWVPKAPIEAAKNGNKVIMSPGNPLYFDTPPDQNSIYNVFHFKPVPAGLTQKEAKGIIGAQANLWTENVPSENRADYMYFPRMTSLAENLWNGQYDYPRYLNNLQPQYARLDLLNVHYRLPDIKGLVEEYVFTDQALINLQKPLANSTLRYTTDGSRPSSKSTVLNGSLNINTNTLVKLAAFKSDGSLGDVYNLNFTKQALAEPISKSVQAGLQCNFYPGSYKSSTLLDAVKPTKVFVTKQVIVPDSAQAPSFGLQYLGYIAIPLEGIYSFYLTCDDGGILKIADRMVVDNDGWHAPVERSGQAALKKGLHPFKLSFVEGGGGYTLKLKYSKDGSAPVEVPDAWLKH